MSSRTSEAASDVRLRRSIAIARHASKWRLLKAPVSGSVMVCSASVRSTAACRRISQAISAMTMASVIANEAPVVRFARLATTAAVAVSSTRPYQAAVRRGRTANASTATG
jgi:hypothetical protein